MRAGSRQGIRWAIAMAISFASLAIPSSAAADEQTTDGGFEQTVCPTDFFSCTNAQWPEAGTQAFVCRSPTCPTNGPNIPRTGVGWVQLGGDIVGAFGTETGSISQTVNIPRAPATLSYWVKAYSIPSPASTLTVSVDGTVVETTPDPGGSNSLPYTQHTVNLSSFAGGSHVLEFKLTCTRNVGSVDYCDVFLIDDVSLDALPALPAPPPVTPSAVAPETKLTGTPKAKTRSKQAQFTFSADRSGATFECSLDGGAFGSCVSPRILKVGKGKHNFQVRAAAEGLVDATPASFAWKVVKKKKPKKKR